MGKKIRRKLLVTRPKLKIAYICVSNYVINIVLWTSICAQERWPLAVAFGG
jgi:hypothetical protein